MKKSVTLLSVILVIGLFLAACAPAATPQATTAPAEEATSAPVEATAAPVEPTAATSAAETTAVQINFWSWVPSIQDQVDEWNAAHPEIQVNYVNPGNGNTEYTKLNTALQANSDIPDVVQIEYQHLPNYIALGALADLSAFGVNDLKDNFIPWTWSQVTQGDAVYALPQDAGPMVMFCNDAVLQKNNIAVPTTWDEFAKAAANLHAADANVYLSNFTADQGWFFGMLWQAGANPFIVNGTDISVDFTSDAAMKVAKYWGDLIKSGNLSAIDTYTSDWNTAIGNGTIACWQAGAWGTYISTYGPDYSGKWSVYQLPQWNAGEKANGNYGGSVIAVTKASQNAAAAAEFVKWLNTDSKVTLELTNPDKAGLFPVTNDTLTNKEWSDVTYDYWSGKAIHQVMAEAAQDVLPEFGWSPFTNFVYTTYADDLTLVRAGSMSFEDALNDLQTKCTQYATDQGFTVKE